MPIVMVLIGCFYYKDSLTKLQKVACYFALAGTIYTYVLASGLSWVVLVVALGYPVYFMFRKTNPMPTDIGLGRRPHYDAPFGYLWDVLSLTQPIIL